MSCTLEAHKLQSKLKVWKAIGCLSDWKRDQIVMLLDNADPPRILSRSRYGHDVGIGKEENDNSGPLRSALVVSHETCSTFSSRSEGIREARIPTNGERELSNA